MYNKWLIKIGEYTFPMEYIEEKTYYVTPNQRQDKDPWRSEAGVLNRTVLQNTPTSITFSTIDGITNTELATIYQNISENFIDEQERKVLVTFYDPPTDSYPESVYMYLANTEYNIDYIEGETIHYKQITLEFTGY